MVILAVDFLGVGHFTPRLVNGLVLLVEDILIDQCGDDR